MVALRNSNAHMPTEFTEATTAFAHGDIAAALRLARIAVQKGPDSAQCLTFLGCVLEASGRTDE